MPSILTLFIVGHMLQSCSSVAAPRGIWLAPNGLKYDLRNMETIFEFGVRGDPRAAVYISLTETLPCVPSTNPRHVAACLMTGEGERVVLGLKSDFRFEALTAPTAGLRLWFTWSDRELALDVLCDKNVEIPAVLDLVDRLTASEMTGYQDAYFAKIRSTAGCPIKGEQHAAIPQTLQYIEWTHADGRRSIRYSSPDILEQQILVEFDAPHQHDAIEISLGSPLACGDITELNTHTPQADTIDNVAVCYYKEGQRPMVAGLKHNLKLHRAHDRGVQVVLQGERCSPSLLYQTHLQFICQKDTKPSTLSAWRRVGGDGCNLFAEIVSSFGCGVEQKHTATSETVKSTLREPAGTAVRSQSSAENQNIAADSPQISKLTTAPPPVIDMNNVKFDKDVNEYGCQSGNCLDGAGMYAWRTGSTYSGQWKAGKRHGHGIHNWPDGRQYDGKWEEDLRHGFGRHRFTSGDTYEGLWQRDQKHGPHAKYLWANGNTFEGDFENDEMHGTGIRTWTDGTIYKGEFVHGVEAGYGIKQWKNGTRWSGTFAEGHPTDDGMILCTNGLLLHDGQCLHSCPSLYHNVDGRCESSIPDAWQKRQQAAKSRRAQHAEL